MKTEIAYPHYPGYVQPTFSRGLNYEQIEGVLYDPRVVECLTGLLSEVLKHPLVPRDKKFNQDYYSLVMDSLHHLNYVRLVMTIAAAYITGRSVSEVVWEDKDGKVVPAKFIPRPGEYLIYKWDTASEGFYPVIFARGTEHRVDKYPRQFIISHYWAIPNADPYGNGLAECLYPLIQARGRALEDWVKYSSTYAEPTRVGHYPNSASDEEIVMFNGFINRLGSARAVTLPEGFQVTYINPPPTTGATQSDLYDRVSQDISLLINGEGTAGRQHVGGTATQDEVSSDLRGSRAYLLGSLISHTISSTISRWIGELNFPNEPPLELTYDQEKEAPSDETPEAPAKLTKPLEEAIDPQKTPEFPSPTVGKRGKR